MSTAERRMNITLAHLRQMIDNNDIETNFTSSSSTASIQLADPLSRTKFQKTNVDVPKLSAWFDGKYADLKTSLRKVISENEWPHDFQFDTLNYHEQRKVVMVWAKQLADRLPFDMFHALRHDYSTYVTFSEQVALLNTNVAIKAAVQYSLFGGCVANLGTDRHHQLMKDLAQLKLLGSFGMTEKGHGSNVRGIETTATYDKTTREFVVNTPHVKAMKTWIGGSGFAHMSAVFANLIIDGQNKGVHVFLVPLRDQKGTVLPGVFVEDCEYKLGLNGIDNMSFGFKNVRIPRVNLLNRFSDVTEDGRYVCQYPEAKHFGMTVGELSGGRLTLSGHTVSICKQALAIAIRYGFQRKQFGPPGKGEVAIMSYPTHYRRLMPLLAKTVALVPYLSYCLEVFADREKDAASLALGHSLSSLIKVSSSWHMLELLSVCRQCCGGAGFRAPNKISGFLRDTHIYVTFEGDNTVLSQQTAKYLLGLYAQGVKSGRFSGLLDYANNAKETLPLSTSTDDKLLSLKYLLQLFREREFAMIQELAGNLQKRRQSGQSEWDAFNAELVLAKDLALAHNDRIVHELFSQSSQICSFANTGVLTLLAQLNGLTAIKDNLGWFVANEVLPASAAKRVEPLIIDLSREVCKYSLDIVEAFQIPAKLLPPADLSNYTVPANHDYKFSQ